MALSTFSVRMDETLKKQFDSLCSDFGMSASTAFNVFARTVVRERKIPFEIVASKSETPTRESGYSAFRSLRGAAKDSGVQDWSLEEINNEINAARCDQEAGL
ncbi:MAG: type II toxin-antitoxin system RelB/DinJ family antitoxin [Oscillospiraceae bacterium]|nr:type II toxin-antitoxin system RelB/DinJ family antitoxin [Oscillospiraceae bacterium]